MNLKKCSLKNMWSSPTYCFFQEIWSINSDEIDLHVHGEKFIAGTGLEPRTT